MKRDWDLLRKQLNNIEEGRNAIVTTDDLDEGEKEKEENRQLGHLELLIGSKFIEGIHIGRNINGQFTFASANPRLTMAGHDFLDTLRSPKLWETVKLQAKKNGIELSISVIKHLAEKGLSHVF